MEVSLDKMARGAARQGAGLGGSTRIPVRGAWPPEQGLLWGPGVGLGLGWGRKVPGGSGVWLELGDGSEGMPEEGQVGALAQVQAKRVGGAVKGSPEGVKEAGGFEIWSMRARSAEVGCASGRISPEPSGGWISRLSEGEEPSRACVPPRHPRTRKHRAGLKESTAAPSWAVDGKMEARRREVTRSSAST